MGWEKRLEAEVLKVSGLTFRPLWKLLGRVVGLGFGMGEMFGGSGIKGVRVDLKATLEVI